MVSPEGVYRSADVSVGAGRDAYSIMIDKSQSAIISFRRLAYWPPSMSAMGQQATSRDAVGKSASGQTRTH